VPTVVDKVCGFGNLQDLEINEAIVYKKLEKLRMDKAPGADNLLPRFLKEITNELSYSLTIVLSKFLRTGSWQMLALCLKKGAEDRLVIIDWLV
jgi:hypothetical protein